MISIPIKSYQLECLIARCLLPLLPTNKMKNPKTVRQSSSLHAYPSTVFTTTCTVILLCRTEIDKTDLLLFRCFCNNDLEWTSKHLQ